MTDAQRSRMQAVVAAREAKKSALLTPALPASLTVRRVLREEAGWTQAEVAAFCSGEGPALTKQAVCLWEGSAVEPQGERRALYASLLREFLVLLLKREQERIGTMEADQSPACKQEAEHEPPPRPVLLRERGIAPEPSREARDP